MVYNRTLTIWELPLQPLLPVNDIKDPVFVTIWLVGSFAAAFYLRLLLKRSENPTWQEFGVIRYGALCLAIWYVARATDRWLRWDQRTPVPYGYALAEPMIDALRVTSTILILWGTYTVVWKELEDQFSPKQQGIWWFAARFLLFIVTLMAIFYTILSIALAVVWLEFFNLNSIADIAGKRNDFEMAMTSFFLLFSILTLVEATVTWFHAFKIHGQVQRTRLFMWLAALFLFVRCTSEFAIVYDLFRFRTTRQNMKFTSDVSYGFFTMLYLAMMCVMAKVAAATFDSGGTQAKMVASDVRHYILAMLESDTNGGRTEAPPFETVLREVESNLDAVLSRGPLTGGLGTITNMDSTYKEVAAMNYIEQLRTEFGSLDPNREGNDDHSRPPSTLSVLTALLGRQSRQSVNVSSTNLNTKAVRLSPSNASAITGSTAVSRPMAPRSFRGTPSLYSHVHSASFSAAAALTNPVLGASPPPNTYDDGVSRWAPSLRAFPEHPHPQQGINTTDHQQPSISIATSPSPKPPPLARALAPITRRPVTYDHNDVPQFIPATESGSIAVSRPEQPILPVVSSVSATPSATDADHNSSQPLLLYRPSENRPEEHRFATSQAQNHSSRPSSVSPLGVDSRPSELMPLTPPAPQPVPLPSTSESTISTQHQPIVQARHSVSAPYPLPNQYLQADPTRDEESFNPSPIFDVNGDYLFQPVGPSNTLPSSKVTPSHSAPFPSEFSQGPLSLSSAPTSFAPASSSKAAATPKWSSLPKNQTTSASAKRKSASPLATAGSSYRFLQAKRAVGAAGPSDPLASASGTSSTGTGYQVQPYSSASGSKTSSSNTTTPGSSKQKLAKNVFSQPGPSRPGQSSRQSRASPVPTSVPKPTPPPPPRAIYSATAAYDTAGYDNTDYGGPGSYHNSSTNQYYDDVYYDASSRNDELPPSTSGTRQQQQQQHDKYNSGNTASGGSGQHGARDRGSPDPRYT